MTATNLQMLRCFLLSFDWSGLTTVEGTDAKLNLVNCVLFSAQEAFCPLESFKVKTNRHYFASAKLARLSKEKSKEFKKHRYSVKFKRLKRECRVEI